MAGHKHPSYIKIYFILLALFVVSVAGPEIAHIFGMEGLSRTVLVLSTAFGIALWKAYLVCAYFMHLKFEKIYAPYILLACLSLLFVFFFGTATDAMFSNGHNWVKPYSEEAAAEEAKSRSHGGHDEHGDGHSEGDHDGEEHNEEGDKDSHETH
ncbi:MAG: caa(3)-type oxidase subunit IV [Candidatus Pelagisphaera sp.]|jgi:caa(3)-type oxidase subunit IV